MINKPYDWLDFRVQQAFIFFWKWVEVLVLKSQQKTKIVYLSGLLLVISYYMLYFKLMLSGCWSWLLYCGDPDCLICCGHTWYVLLWFCFQIWILAVGRKRYLIVRHETAIAYKKLLIKKNLNLEQYLWKIIYVED